MGGRTPVPVGEAPHSSTDRRTHVQTYPSALRRDPRGRRARPRRLRREGRRPAERRHRCAARLPGHGRRRSPWTSGPRRSSRCRRPPPRCSSRSAPARRSPPSTTSRTTRPTCPRPTCPASSRTPRRSPARTPTWWCSPTTRNKIVDQLGTLKIPVYQPRRRPPRRLVPADHRAGHAHRARRPRPTDVAARMKDDIGKLVKDLPQRADEADLLPRAGPEAVQRDQQDLHRLALRAGRSGQHRRRRRRRRHEAAATRSCPRRSSSRPTRTSSSWPTPSAASRAPTRSRPAAAGPASPR